jgi:hypothetical protein
MRKTAWVTSSPPYTTKEKGRRQKYRILSLAETRRRGEYYGKDKDEWTTASGFHEQE